MPTYDDATGKPLQAANGKPADGCECCETIPCCTLCCGITPKTVDLGLFSFSGWVTWFNATDSEWRITRLANGNYFELRAAGSISETDVQLAFAGQFGETCGWHAWVTPASLKFQWRYYSAYTDSFTDWEDIEGQLHFSIGLSRVDAYDIEALLLINFVPDAGQDPYNLTRSTGTISCGCGCGRGVIFYDYYSICPMSFNALTWTNEAKAHTNSYNPLDAEPCPEVGSAAPGTVISYYGAPGCVRTDCSEDCGETDEGCLTGTEYATDCLSCAGGVPVVTGSTNTGISDWDFFFYGEFTDNAIEDQSTGVIYSNNGTEGNIYFQMYCTNQGSGPIWRYVMRGRQGEGYDDGYITFEVEADPVTGCPPASVVITAENAEVWEPLPGVDEVTITITCL